MGKKKPKDEVEVLEQKIRELKSINRNLMKRLKKVDRNFKEVIDDSVEEDSVAQKEDPNKRTCPHCSRGEIAEISILGRVFLKCTVCDWRSRATKTKP